MTPGHRDPVPSVQSAPEHPPGGHTVLVVPVPPLEEFVRARTAFYDDSFVSTDPGWSHAHLTLLGPWAPTPDPAHLARVGEALTGVAAFEVVLARVGRFPDGILHAVPEPDAGLRALIARLVAAFPEFPPYGGRHGVAPAPHVTLDLDGAAGPHGPVTPAALAAEVAPLLPARLEVREVHLQRWANHGCRLLHRWSLTPAEEAP